MHNESIKTLHLVTTLLLSTNLGAINMEIPKRITFIDVQGKKYVLPVKIMVSRFILERFFQHAPPREKDSTVSILTLPLR